MPANNRTFIYFLDLKSFLKISYNNETEFCTEDLFNIIICFFFFSLRIFDSQTHVFVFRYHVEMVCLRTTFFCQLI